MNENRNGSTPTVYVYLLIISASFEKYVTVVLWDSITRIGKQTPLYCHYILHLILGTAFVIRKLFVKLNGVVWKHCVLALFSNPSILSLSIKRSKYSIHLTMDLIGLLCLNRCTKNCCWECVCVCLSAPREYLNELKRECSGNVIFLILCSYTPVFRFYIASRVLSRMLS